VTAQDEAPLREFSGTTPIGLAGSLGELVRSRDLLWSWVGREIKIRYKQSILGAAWAVLQPLALMLMFTLVFSLLINIDTGDIPYPLFSYTAVLPWTFVSTSITFATSSLLTNMNLVTKTYFPREVLPLGSIGAALLDFLVASTVFAGLMIIYRVPLTTESLWLPLLLSIQVALIVGVALITSSLAVTYRDIRFVVPLGLQLWFYATPVIYPLSLIPDGLRPFYVLNPMAALIDSYRAVLLHGQAPRLEDLAVAASVALVVLVAGYWVFKRLEPTFADVI
jgi:ABC-type polysaccharide/polyol phosphate export permease